MRTSLPSAVALLAVLAGPAPAQVASGPSAGDRVAALQVHAVAGPIEDKEADYAAERKDKPTVYVFLRADKWDRPMFRFLKGLGEAVRKESEDALVVAVWLTEKPDETKDYLPKLKGYDFQATALTYFAGEPAGPKGWSINSMAHLTAVVANRGKVAASIGYVSLNEADVAEVRDALKKAVKK